MVLVGAIGLDAVYTHLSAALTGLHNPTEEYNKGPRPRHPPRGGSGGGNPTSGWQKHWPGKRTRATYWGLREAFERGEGGSIQTDGATEPAPRPRREGQTPKAHTVLGGERAGGGQESLQRTGRMVGGALLGGGGGTGGSSNTST